jgi:hypothetical protein
MNDSAKNLTRIAYISTLRPLVTGADLDILVDRAAALNKEHGITGILAIDGDRVCQILEGPTVAVDMLYASIEKDPRHFDVIQLEHRAIHASGFEDWGMIRKQMVDIVVYALAS